MDRSDPYWVLRHLGHGLRKQTTVVRQYKNWRSSQKPPIPMRCDNDNCLLHVENPVWNDEDLTLQLDHQNGVHSDNRPTNLRFLCPNCHSQETTYGGGNKDKVKDLEDTFRLLKEGRTVTPVNPSRSTKTTGKDISIKKTD